MEGLRLVLSMDATKIRMYDSIFVRVEEQNILPQSLNVSAAENWVTGALGSFGGCAGPDVVGIAVFQGNYTKNNLPRNGELRLEGMVLPYPYCYRYHSYAFQPHSALATEAYACEPYPNFGGMGCQCNPNPCPALITSKAPTQFDLTISKYFDISTTDHYSSYHYFSPGTYTVVGADEWGAEAILHFVVANPGCPFPQTGETNPPFANELSAVNGTWKFDFELNSTFVFRDQSIGVSASLTDTNITDSIHPSILVSRPFPASLQFISPNGTVVWTYPPSPLTSLTYITWISNAGIDVTNRTIAQLQSNQTYTVVAKPMLFIQPDQPITTGLEIRMSFTVC
jgi:hypothetical protein